MDFEHFRAHCLAKKGVTESLPFDDTSLVFKVLDKIFAIATINARPLSANLKCDPEWALELRAANPAIQPGYHMNKKHWNTVVFDGSIKPELALRLIDHSYELVVRHSLKKSEREALERL